MSKTITPMSLSIRKQTGNEEEKISQYKQYGRSSSQHQTSEVTRNILFFLNIHPLFPSLQIKFLVDPKGFFTLQNFNIYMLLFSGFDILVHTLITITIHQICHRLYNILK